MKWAGWSRARPRHAMSATRTDCSKRPGRPARSRPGRPGHQLIGTTALGLNLSHLARSVVAVEVVCEHCGQPARLVTGDEMTSATRRYRCNDCRVDYIQDPSGLITEDVPSPR